MDFWTLIGLPTLRLGDCCTSPVMFSLVSCLYILRINDVILYVLRKKVGLWKLHVALLIICHFYRGGKFFSG